MLHRVSTPSKGAGAKMTDDTPPVDPARITSKYRVERAVFPEVGAGGFVHFDQEVAFFNQVHALLRPEHVVLDFGAGRGEFMTQDPVRYRRELQNLRGRCAHVDGCDVDPVVAENPTLDAAAVFAPGEPLPYPDARFDLIVSRYVFEHLPDPAWAARELMRVLKPGGWLCVMTPNKWGYVALGARLIPNRLHAKALRRLQPHRLEEDVFPTAYKLNTVADVKRWFGEHADVHHYSTSAVPSYHLGSPALMRALLVLHRVLPPALDLGLRFFIRKR